MHLHVHVHVHVLQPLRIKVCNTYTIKLTHFVACRPTRSLSAEEAWLRAGEVAMLADSGPDGGGLSVWYFSSMALRSWRRRSMMASSSSESGSMSITLEEERNRIYIYTRMWA